MAITRKYLIGTAVTAAALFLIATPLGDSHHGAGRHSKFAADLGQTLFVASIVLVLVFIALAVIAIVQRMMTSRRQGA